MGDQAKPMVNDRQRAPTCFFFIYVLLVLSRELGNDPLANYQ